MRIIQKDVSREQYNNVKKAILRSPDAEDRLSKKFLFWVMKQTDGFREDAIIDIGDCNNELVQKLAKSFRGAISAGGSTHLNTVLEENGTEMFMTTGAVINNGCPHENKDKGITHSAIYIRHDTNKYGEEKNYAYDNVIPLNMKEIEKMDLAV